MIALVPAAVCAVAISCQAQQRTLLVPAQYATISGAISAANPGDTVKVANGVYHEQLIIDKAIRVVGSAPGQTILDGLYTSALSGLGQVRVVAGGDVDFSMFTIRNAGRPGTGPSDHSVAIYTESPVPGVTYSIHHTRLIGAGDPSVFELGLHSFGGREHLDFHHNDIGGDFNIPSWIDGHPGAVTIRDNSVTMGISDYDPIWVRSEGFDITAPVRILRNTVNMGPGDGVAFPNGILVDCGWTGSGGSFADLEIADNVVKNILQNRRGIAVAAWTPGSHIDSAVIQRNRVLGRGGYTGIAAWGYCDGVAILDNQILGITGLASVGGVSFPGTNGGIRLRPYFTAVAPTRTRISGNMIEALRGISVEGDGSLTDITHNLVWALGPTTVELGELSTANAVSNNILRTLAQRGDATVLDSGTGNVVSGNR